MMIDPQERFEKVIKILDEKKIAYKLFEHREALTYEDLEAVQKETGFFGTEMKCMVLRANENFFVYVTLQGKRLNIETISEVLRVKRVKLATAEELAEFFGAKPGCAYPFGFDENIPLYIDPTIYDQEWLVFSPVLPTRTVQLHGTDFKKIIENLPNKVIEVENFNQ